MSSQTSRVGDLLIHVRVKPEAGGEDDVMVVGLYEGRAIV